MPLFHLDWFRCLDGYRIERRPVPPGGEEWLEDGSERSNGSERFIVPNSPNNWEEYRPLEIPAAYRQFANWAKRDTSEDGLLKLINAYGSLWRPKAKHEHAQDVVRLILRIQNIVEAIDRRDWQSIAQGLEREAQARRRSLAVVFEVSANPPTLKLRPGSLAEALVVQALADASLGIGHRKCKNPECDRYFPVGGEGAYRSDAEYHSPACQRRHTYLKRLKKGRRS
jgi:hypothetical protein